LDVAGRPRIGFLHSVEPAAGAEEIIIDPHTYRLMGTGTWGIRVALLKRPGVMP
jgi:hypothetical protein